MNLLKRAIARVRGLKEQGCKAWANRLGDAVRMFERRFRPKPEVPAPLTELNSALVDLFPLPEKIALVKKETLKREAEVLAQILVRVSPFVPLLDDSEAYYRKFITIFSRSESVPLYDDRSFSYDIRLVLYEDSRLTRVLRFCETCTRGFEWEQGEEKLDSALAVSIYGLNAIVPGIAMALKRAALDQDNAQGSDGAACGYY
jgi:hypothetical protein